MARPLQLGQALRLVVRTLPVVGLRLVVLVLLWLAGLVYVGAVGVLVYFAARAVPGLGIALGVIGAVGMIWLGVLVRRYVLYLIKTSQIAVMAELLGGGGLPKGTSQLRWGRERVVERFGEVSAMFVVDQVVSAVVAGFTGLVYGLVSWLPGTTLRGLARLAGRLVHYAVTYVDEAILARTFWLDDGTVWQNARDGVVLYAMVWKPLLVKALALTALSLSTGVMTVLLVSAPVGWLANSIWPGLGGWSILVALALGWAAKVGIGDSFAMAAMIAAYQRSIQGLRPDPTVLGRLSQVPRFDELAQGAEQEAATQRLDPSALPDDY